MLFWLLAVGLLIAAVFELLPMVVVWPLFAVAVAAAIIDALWTIREIRRTNVAMGTAALIGKQAVVRTDLAPEGYVFIQGERWAARIEDGAAAVGDRVRIIGAEGFHLRVEKVT
jgi:membrane-bound serine protease (ClpP class)